MRSATYTMLPEIHALVLGVLWKASITGGVPLLSADVDKLRARARGELGYES